MRIVWRKLNNCVVQGAGKSCNGDVLNRGVTKEEITEILEAHNSYRAKIAQGKEMKGRPGPQPGAANMHELDWDPELAAIAQMHVDQCQFEHDCSIQLREAELCLVYNTRGRGLSCDKTRLWPCVHGIV